jgi:RHS repeat-associated protein
MFKVALCTRLYQFWISKPMNFSGKILNYVDGIPGSDSDVTTEHTYNADGLPLTLTAKNASTGDQTTSFTYGTTLSDSDIARNDLLRNTEYPASSSGEEVEYTYNRLGQITSVTDSNGTVREYDYDGLGRLQHDRATTLASGVNGDIKRITRSYDLRGMVAKVTSYDNSSKTLGNVVNEVERKFNGFAQITHEYQSHSGAVNTSTTPYVEYSYANGAANHIRKTGMITPDGLSLTYDYGSSGSMDDRVSRVRAIKEGSTDRVVYSYLGLDQRVEIEYDQPGVEMSWVGTSGGDGGDIYRGLDRFGRVIDMPWKKGMTELARTEYGYDRNSNRTWRNSPGTDQDEFYTYDDVNRLESRDQGTLNAGKTAISGTPVEEEVFDLDATANVENYLLKENGTTQLNQSRTYAANNENVLIAGSGTNVAFDANGNMTTLPVVGDFSSKWTAAYDAWNRLVRINSGGSPLEDYLYDGLNRRVQKDDGSVRDFYYSDEWQIVEERIANATPADKTHVWGLRYIDDLVWIDDGATREYALHDYYSIIAVTNASGVVQQRYGFSAYGERKVLDASYTQTSSSATSDVGYGGYFEDAGTKMYQVRNRFLHPGLGRWINRDPIGYGGNVTELRDSKISPK